MTRFGKLPSRKLIRIGRTKSSQVLRPGVLIRVSPLKTPLPRGRADCSATPAAPPRTLLPTHPAQKGDSEVLATNNVKEPTTTVMEAPSSPHIKVDRATSRPLVDSASSPSASRRFFRQRM